MHTHMHMHTHIHKHTAQKVWQKLWIIGLQATKNVIDKKIPQEPVFMWQSVLLE